MWLVRLGLNSHPTPKPQFLWVVPDTFAKPQINHQMYLCNRLTMVVTLDPAWHHPQCIQYCGCSYPPPPYYHTPK